MAFGEGRMLTFSVKTKIMIGDLLDQVLIDFRRVLIITDRFMAQSKKVDYVIDRLNASAEHRVFSKVSPDPDINSVVEGITHLKEFCPDVVVAFGGGSAIDAAKAVVYFSHKVQALSAGVFVAVPTTSGTGSEVSKFAVITDEEKQIKYAIVDEELLPDVAVLDANLTVSVPGVLTADTGMDVFTHAVESYVSTAATDFSKALSKEALALVKEHLLRAYSEPQNRAARQGMHNASCLAGIAFSNAGLGITHSMAHALGAHFHVPHGRANAILLPYVMSFNLARVGAAPSSLNEYALLANAMGVKGASTRQSALNLVRMAYRYSQKMKIPLSIKEAGIEKHDFESALGAMVKASMSDPCTATNPKKCCREDLALIYEKAYQGTLF
jgi:alcohol dehydrogenase class IV